MAIVGDEFLCAPFSGRGVVAVVHDFEPAVSGCVVGCGGVVDFFHVDGTGSLVADVDGAGLRSVGPVAPFEGDGVSSFGRGNACHAGLSIDA